MLHSDLVGLPGLAALALTTLLFAVSLFAARQRRDTGDTAKGASSSVVGIMVQGFGIFTAGFGPVLVGLDPLGTKALVEGVAVALLAGTAIVLFVWSARTMGRNWSLRARTRADHQLVQDGPFRLLRHPIYAAMALFTLALALALGHTRQLMVAVPLFAVGTWLRIRSEETLLRGMFGADYDRYARRVKRFGLF